MTGHRGETDKTFGDKMDTTEDNGNDIMTSKNDEINGDITRKKDSNDDVTDDGSSCNITVRNGDDASGGNDGTGVNKNVGDGNPQDDSLLVMDSNPAEPDSHQREEGNASAPSPRQSSPISAKNTASQSPPVPTENTASQSPPVPTETTASQSSPIPTGNPASDPDPRAPVGRCRRRFEDARAPHIELCERHHFYSQGFWGLLMYVGAIWFFAWLMLAMRSAFWATVHHRFGTGDL
ncbi:hypothetical protein F5B18DRAFT_182865 [Nemania serpens]|nr:hypothetical protein F5B18DRAFT_182865 [Nemania serpens]